MKKSYFVSILACLILFSVCMMVGCGSNATGGGSSGGGGGSTLTANIYVSTTGSDDAGDGTLAKPYRTIQKGLDMATSHEVVGVLAGVYTQEVTWPASTDVTLRGVSKTTAIMHGENADSIIVIPGTIPTSQTITIESLTLENNVISPNGGAIRNDSNSNNIHLKQLIIKNNSAGAASDGGGVFAQATTGTLIVESCSFIDNFADDGGAIHAHCPTLITNCIIKDNTAGAYAAGISFGTSATSYIYNTTIEANVVTTGGGGFFNQGSDVTFEGCTFNNNVAAAGAAGNVNTAGGTRTHFKKCVFNNNRSTGVAGAILADNSLKIERCLFNSNTSEANGGAVYVGANLEKAQIVNSVFIKNKAKTEGGAIYFSHNAGTTMEVWDCTFVSNEAASGGSAFQVNNGEDVEIVNCIFWLNKSNGGSPYEVMSGSNDYDVSHSDYQAGALDANAQVSNQTNAIPLFVSYPNDLHLSNACTTEITEGGDDDVRLPTDDYDGNPRTSSPGYSMGAYEKN